MGDFGRWAAAICAVAIGCAAVRLLAPKTGSGGLLRGATAVFFLCALLAPLTGMTSLPLPDIPSSDASPDPALSELAADQLCRQAEEAIAGLCERYLTEYDIQVEKVTVHADISSDGSIYLSRVTLRLDKPGAADAWTVRQLMQTQLGVPVEVETP
ncbi:MAG: hypothetical protein ACOYJY_08055 [Acutalibacteraceae bacterium]|jgi:hypothetical protein